jgi:dienelactone hydrolase
VTWLRWLVLFVALIGTAWSVWQLDRARAGLAISALSVGTTPATVTRMPSVTSAPVVIIAHGFAGSRPLMEGFVLTLARAGYIVVSYDLLGHGRNPVPMSGDVTDVDGTTKVLMDELGRISDAALALPGADGRLALLGHSMASDIVVRQAIQDIRVDAVVAVSMFSHAVTKDQPRNLLVITGEWEGMLAIEAEKALQLADKTAKLGETVGSPALGTGRRAVLAPNVEHVSVLYSRTTLTEARDWLNASFGRSVTGDVPARGGWIALLLVSIVALGWPLAGALRNFRADAPPFQLPRKQFLTAILVPALTTPLILWPLDIHFLPVLVADYLAVHFALFGLLALGLVAMFGGWHKGGALTALILAVPLALFGIAVFGTALDHYVASFVPVAGRIPVVLAMAVGAVPFMLADAVLTEGGRAPFWRVITVRGLALASLGLAVALDFEGLFFLVIILPIILLFFILFGTVGGWIGRATWRPAAAGVGLGLFLAWALAVTFPMFAA